MAARKDRQLFCGKCGNLLGDHDSRCPVCGEPVQQTAATARRSSTNALSLTFIEDGTVIAQAAVDLTHNSVVRFGSENDNDIVVNPPSRTVSSHHGTIAVNNGWCFLHDNNSLNGLYINGAQQQRFRICPGDTITIGKPQRGSRRCVIVVGTIETNWKIVPLRGKQSVSIGRSTDNDLVLPAVTVSAHHARIMRDNYGWHIQDLGSTNGTLVNGAFVLGTQEIFSGTSLMLGSQQLLFLDDCLLVVTERHGVDVVANGLVRYRKNGHTTRITTDHISLHIKRGEFVAIVGGSGCGKSTLLNELNGSEPADEGTVELDGTDLYANYKMLKGSIGYVPQQDIVYDNLRLENMLAYAAKLRMQPDTTAQERRERIEEVISLLELDNVRQNYIGKLSGGQKKRASIAVELLADPRLLFLDEPTSGLDPGIERKLMQSLANMAHDGRTIILVTHTTLNLHLCDQVVFLGPGGKLCFAGKPQNALAFFGVSDFVEVYPKMEENPTAWEQKFANHLARTASVGGSVQQESLIGQSKTSGFFSQLATLTARYAKITLNDRARLVLLVAQAPLLAFLIHLVAGSGVFSICEDTKFFLFALSCAAFWVGVFDSIQEICKENNIFVRECDGGLRIGSYLASKFVVQAVLCFVQTLLLVAVLVITRGTPNSEGALINPTLELTVSTYLTVLSAMSLGLLVSALFKSPDKALAMAPILIMPQILFSGIAFELNGLTENVSYAINCRWAIEAMGTTSDLNGLDLAIYGEEIVIPAETRTLKDQEIKVPEISEQVDVPPVGKQKVTIPSKVRHFDSIKVSVPRIDDKVIDANMVEHEADEMFEHTTGHLFMSWAILAGMSIACVVGCYILLALGTRK